MRIGYSIVSSEMVEAHLAEYGDCAKYQIVCPCCREAVFKAKREETHYFSHYGALTEEARQCELRVDLLSKQLYPHQHRQFNSHGQTLAHFMSVLRESVVQGQDKADAVDADVLRQDIMRIMAFRRDAIWDQPIRQMFDYDLLKRNVLGQLVGKEYTIEALQRMTEASTMSRTQSECEKVIKTVPLFHDKSPFWVRRQASYCSDIMGHLATGQASDNLSFMAAACYSTLARAGKLYLTWDGTREEENTLVLTVAWAQLMMTNKSTMTCLQTVREMVRKAISDNYMEGFDAGVKDAAMDLRVRPHQWPKSGLTEEDTIDFKYDLLASAFTGRRASLTEEDAEKINHITREEKRHAKQFKKNYQQGWTQKERKEQEMRLDRMTLLEVTARIYPVFIGLLAAVPWSEMHPKEVK